MTPTLREIAQRLRAQIEDYKAYRMAVGAGGRSGCRRVVLAAPATALTREIKPMGRMENPEG